MTNDKQESTDKIVGSTDGLGGTLPPFYTARKCSQCGYTEEWISKHGCPEQCWREAAP